MYYREKWKKSGKINICVDLKERRGDMSVMSASRKKYIWFLVKWGWENSWSWNIYFFIKHFLYFSQHNGEWWANNGFESEQENILIIIFSIHIRGLGPGNENIAIHCKSFYNNCLKYKYQHQGRISNYGRQGVSSYVLYWNQIDFDNILPEVLDLIKITIQYRELFLASLHFSL